MNRHGTGYLCLTPGQAALWIHAADGARRLAVWPDAEADRGAAFCAGGPGLQLLVEDPADLLHVERTPPVAAHHRRHWAHFRLERLFPSAPCRGWLALPGRRTAFSAPARPAALAGWLAALYRHRVVVHGVQSAALLTAGLAAHIAAGHDGVVLCVPAFADPGLHFVRPAPDYPLSRVVSGAPAEILFRNECRHLADDLPPHPAPNLIVLGDPVFSPPRMPDWPFAMHALPADLFDNARTATAAGVRLREARKGKGLLEARTT